ncbi:hypothetical protein DFH08DRAFT_821220 [Mycena albidolilacea]|uniref:Uncharacterized protein n=1 Tax=Mycena albidolilacea TaxID=1033008 RepID=A0AAD6ZB29_9AGAR|nr:hypothetical protein DFH08DRAFT_821220 [Mycena albidolilacea]
MSYERWHDKMDMHLSKLGEGEATSVRQQFEGNQQRCVPKEPKNARENVFQEQESPEKAEEAASQKERAKDVYERAKTPSERKKMDEMVGAEEQETPEKAEQPGRKVGTLTSNGENNTEAERIKTCGISDTTVYSALSAWTQSWKDSMSAVGARRWKQRAASAFEPNPKPQWRNGILTMMETFTEN